MIWVAVGLLAWGSLNLLVTWGFYRAARRRFRQAQARAEYAERLYTDTGITQLHRYLEDQP